jgi:tetratricopeptide (TPR) repeat protein
VQAYLRLAALLTGSPGEDDPGPAALTDGSRARYQASRLAAAGGDVPVMILHAGPDRAWGEWLAAELGRLEIDARRQRIDLVSLADIEAGASVLLVVSRRLLSAARTGDYLAEIDEQVVPGGHVPLAVSTDDARLRGEQFRHIGHLDLAGQPEEAQPDETARKRLASYYGVAPTAAERGPAEAGGLQFPGRRRGRGTWNLPARGTSFQGREDLMDLVRDHFTGTLAHRPLTLTGPPGIGKSQVALEYAYRFAAQYDLIWLIRADSGQAVRSGLTELAAVIAPQRHGDLPRAALDGLAAYGRSWLLIYDGADAPGDLSELLPGGGRGHILITSRAAPPDSAEQLAVQPLGQDEAAVLLTGLIPGLLRDAAKELAAELLGNPLALDLAASWIRVTVRLLSGVGANPATMTSSAAAEFGEQLSAARNYWPGAGPTERTVGLLTALLRRDPRGPAAAYLLETCACLSPLGLSQRLLRSPRMLAQLESVEADISDPVVLHNVLRPLDTHGFSLLGESPQAPLRVHPLVLEVVRSQLAPDQLRQRSAEVALILAASAPPDIDEDTMPHADEYAELQEHVEPSGAWRQDDALVRRWLVNQVRYLWQTGSVSAWDTAAELGGQLARRWLADLPDGEHDPLLLRLQVQLANIYRSRGDFRRAAATDLGVLELQRAVLGLDHPRTLMTARGYAADLRLTGDFRQALLEDQSTWRVFRDSLGPEHELTLIASSHVAISQLLNGEPELALRRQLLDLPNAQRFREVAPDQVAWILCHTGAFRREIGQFEQSEQDLTEARQLLTELVERDRLPATAPVVLRTAVSLAATRRRQRHPEPGTTEQALRDCRATYGRDHPDTLAISLSYAADLHAARQYPEAVAQARQALSGYTVSFGDHPFTWVSQVSLGSYALMTGDLDLAEEMTSHGLDSLEQGLGRHHLWSLAAIVARASVLAIRGQFPQAEELEEEALAEYRHQLLHTPNPLINDVQANIRHTRMLLNEPGSPAPAPQEARERRLIDLDIPSI